MKYSEQPVVSIICITYNQVNYIRDTLEGFVNQKTDFPYEIIIHDDASTDGTIDVLREYSEQYGNIRLFIEEENQYNNPKRKSYSEQMAEFAFGEYICLCEGDDFWVSNNKLQIQYDFLNSHRDYSMCVHNCYIADYLSDLVYLSECRTEDCDKTFEQLLKEGGGFINPTASFMFKKEGFWKPNDIPVGDHFILMNFASQGKVRYLAKPMSVYRAYAEGSWTNATRKKTDRQINSYYQRYINGILQVEDHVDIATNGFEAKVLELRKTWSERLDINKYLRGDLSITGLISAVGFLQAMKSFAKKNFSDEIKIKLFRFSRRRWALKNNLLICNHLKDFDFYQNDK